MDKLKKREYNQKFYLKYKEELKLKRENNKDKINEYAKKYYAENCDAIKITQKKIYESKKLVCFE